ncbi:MAG: hypothetical protein HKN30_01770, partial [Sulfitobacter sp.]|nr:hypothetical protein [Sulfitobacter sp.]
AIIAHALRMLIFETGTTLRVISPALILVIGSSLLALYLTPEALQALTKGPQEMALPDPTNGSLVFVFILAGLAGYVLMAVLWHRHVLLSGMERDGVMRPSARIFFSYLGRAIVVGLVQLGVALPVTLAMGVLASLGGGSALLVSIGGVLGGIIFAWIALRISLVLPAAAVDARMTIRDSWEATKTMSQTLWGVALLLAGLNLFFFAIGALLPSGQVATTLVGQQALFIVEGLIFVSVLTTLYGHLVEGRSLG